MKKRILAIFLSVALVLGMVPASAFAADEAPAPDYMAAHAGTIIVDGQCNEVSWALDRVMGTGENTRRFGILWDKNNLYIAAEKKDGDGDLAVQLDGAAATPVSSASGAVAEMQIALQEAVSGYDYTAALTLSLGEVTWSGTVGISSLERELIPCESDSQNGVLNMSYSAQAGAAQRRDTKLQVTELLGDPVQTNTLEFDFAGNNMPVVTTGGVYSGIWPCEGFVVAAIDANKNAYVGGIANTEEGLAFCLRTGANTSAAIPLGRDIGDLFHIRLDWTVSGQLDLFLDGQFLHRFNGTRTLNPYGGITNWLMFELYSPAGCTEARTIDFSLSNIRMGTTHSANPLDSLTFADFCGSNTSADAVTNNLDLPLQWSNGQLPAETVTWSSSSEAISAAGVVTQSTEDQFVTLTAALQNGDTKQFTVIVPKLSVKAYLTTAEIALDGKIDAISGDASWILPKSFAVADGNVSGNACALWNKGVAYLAIVHTNATQLELTLGEKTWTLPIGASIQSDDGAVTGAASGNVVELKLDLDKAGISVKSYKQQVPIQIELTGAAGSAKLAQNAIPLVFMGAPVNQLNLTRATWTEYSGYYAGGYPLMMTTTTSSARAVGLQSIDHGSDVYMEQVIYFGKLPATDGAIDFENLTANGYYFWMTDTATDTMQNIVMANVYNNAQTGWTLRVLKDGAAGTYEDIPLGNTGYTNWFRLGFLWKEDNSASVYVNGELKGTVAGVTNQVATAKCGTNSLALKAKFAEGATIYWKSLTIASETYGSIADELTFDKLLPSVNKDAVTQNIALPGSYQSAYLGDLALTWKSSDETVLNTQNGVVTQPEGAVGKYVFLSLLVDGEEIWTEELFVPGAGTATLQGMKPLLVPFANEAPTLDHVISESGWNLNSDIIFNGSAVIGRFGAQWDEEYLYIAASKPNANALKVTINGKLLANTSAEAWEGKVSFQELGITVNNYGMVIPAKIEAGAAVWEGNLILTSNAWAITDSYAPQPAWSSGTIKMGQDEATANQGRERKTYGYRFYDLYEHGGKNPTSIRLYAGFGCDSLADRTTSDYLEFDFHADAMPQITRSYATEIGGFGCYGFSWVMSDKQDANTKMSNIVSMGIFNTADGLVFTIQNRTQNTAREFVSLNKQVGDTFRVGIRWETNGDVVLFVDGVKIATLKDKQYYIQSWGNSSVTFNLLRGTQVAKSSNENYDITVTNVVVGKSLGDSLIDSLNFDTICKENTDPGQITGDLILPDKLTNAQFKNGVAMTWTASVEGIVDLQTGKVTLPEGSGEDVILTATLADGSKKTFDLYVVGQNPQSDVLTVLEDYTPATGVGIVTDVSKFTLDQTNNSIVRNLGEVKTINVIKLKDADAVNRLNESVLTVWVSDDNVTYTQVNDFKLLRKNEYTYLYGFNAEGQYVKVHCTHFDYKEADFVAPLENMIDAYWEDVFGANNKEFSVKTDYQVKNESGVTWYDHQYTILCAATEKARVFLGSQLLYHCVRGDDLVVRIPYLENGAEITLSVHSGNADAMEIANPEGVYEVQYGTREVVEIPDRYLCALPNGKLLAVTRGISEDGKEVYNWLAYTTSEDGGMSWSKQTQIACTIDVVDWVGGITYDALTGRIVVHGIDLGNGTCITRFIYSDDLGESWTLCSDITFKGNSSTYFLSYSNPLILSTNDGSGAGIDMVLNFAVVIPDTNNFCIRVAYTNDGGKTWTMGADEITYEEGEGEHYQEAGLSEATILEAEDGTLVLLARCQYDSVNNFARSVSTDGGLTWQTKAELSDVYTVNAQPILYKFDDLNLLTWGGNTVLGGNSYQRYPLCVAESDDGLKTFKNILDMYSRYSLQGMTSADGNSVVNQTMLQLGDDLLVAWGNNAAEILMMKVSDFDAYFKGTKGAYDSFENSTVKAEGWSVTAGTVGVAGDQAAEGTRSMVLRANSAAVRSIPYLQDGQVTFQLYVSENANMTIELESAYSDVFGKAAPIALEVVNGQLGGVSLNANQWNTISFDLNLSADTPSAALKINGTAADVALNTSVGDYICYVDIHTEDTACYIDDFAVVDNDGKSSETPAEVELYSLLLKGNIGIKYWTKLSYTVLHDPDAYIQFTLADGAVQKIPVSKAVKEEYNGQTYYTFKCEVAAKEMTDQIRAQIFYGNGQATEERSYCVKDYADYILGNDYDDELQQLIAAMLHYGSYAQKYFGYSTDNLADTDLKPADLSGVTAKTLEKFKTTTEGTTKAKFYGASMLLKSETTLRFFFQVEADAKLTVKHGDVSLEVKERNGLYYVDVLNISAKDLGTSITLEISDGSQTAFVSASPMTYCYNVLAAEEGAYRSEMVDLAKALYLYYVEAYGYLGNEEA